jgi:hypothetical protein
MTTRRAFLGAVVAATAAGAGSRKPPLRGPSARSPRTGRHQLGERHEILNPKARPPAADTDVGISETAIRPIDPHRAQAAIGMLEGDSILSPELLGNEGR